MVTHRFARAAESGDPAQIAALLAEDVTFHTPVLTQDLHGKDLTLRFLGEATRIIRNLTYTGEVTDAERVFLFWTGIVDDREISGVTVLADEAGGLIGDITVLLRSWGVVANFRDTLLRALSDVVPLTAWLLGDGKTPPVDPDSGVGQRPGDPLALASDVAFHSPMLTKTARGEQDVRDIHKLIGGIQGPRAYHARITTDNALIEYWTCVIQGHAQQGIDVFELDTQRRVVNQTVWLRPWPVVTFLRDNAIAGQLPSLPADFWLLPAAPSRLSLSSRLDQQRDLASPAAGQAAGDLPQHGGHARAVVDGEVAELVHTRLVPHLAGSVSHGQQPSEAELQRRLVRLVPAADRVVAVRPGRHLDVAAEHVADPPGGGELGEPVQAGDERRHVPHVQPSRVHGVPGEQEAGALVVDGDRRVLVARRAGDLEPSAAEVEGQHLGGPAGEAEVGLHVAQPAADDRRVRPAREVAVAGHVVAVPVGVRHHQLIAGH